MPLTIRPDQRRGHGPGFMSQFTKFRSAWEHAESGALLWMRRVWEWLHTWTHPDEAMLARLWSARKVDLHHPAARMEGEVHAIWTDYLNKQWWRHLVWLIVNGTIAPFSVLLFPLPGPNLIGYWFAYRAVHHTLVVWGIRRVLRKSTPTELHPVAALDLPIERDGDGNVCSFRTHRLSGRPRRARTLAQLITRSIGRNHAPIKLASSEPGTASDEPQTSRDG